MTEDEQRDAVVAAARSWIGTRYHHAGRIKGVGVDCATFLAEVYPEAGVRAPIVIDKYSAQWHLHSEVPLYEEAIVANGGRLVEVPRKGDVALYFMAKQFAHGAIVSDPATMRIVHAYAPARCVVEGDEAEFGQIVGAERKYFTLW